MMTDEGAATANGSFVGNFKKVTAPSPNKLVIELKKPQATMTALDVPIVPKHVWEKVGDFSKFNNDKKFPIVGNGPFILTDYKVDSYVKLKANKDFWRGAPKFDELVFRYYKDQDAAVAALRKGEVSFVPVADPDARAGRVAQGRRRTSSVNDAPGRRFYALATNPGAQAKDGKKFGDGDPALQDQKVRHALFMAVDRKAIVDKVFQGHAVEGAGYIPPRFWHVLLEAVGRAGARVRPGEGGASCSTRRATRRTPTASASARTASRWTSASCATPPTRTTRRSASTSRSGGASSASV